MSEKTCRLSWRPAFSSLSNSASTSRCCALSMSTASISPLTSDRSASANEVRHDADHRQDDEDVNRRRRDVEDTKARYPGERQDDCQQQQHENPLRYRAQPRTPPPQAAEPRQGMTYKLGMAAQRTRWGSGRRSAMRLDHLMNELHLRQRRFREQERVDVGQAHAPIQAVEGDGQRNPGAGEIREIIEVQ